MKMIAKYIAKFGFGVLVLTVFVGCKPLLDLFKGKPKAEKVEVTEVAKVEIEEKADKLGAEQVKATETVLLNINGKPALREEDFNKFLNQMLQVNPYFKGADINSLPAQIKRKFFDELVKQELILAWAEKNNIESTQEFKQAFDEMSKLVKRSLLVQQFETQIFKDISVTDIDVQEYFDKNKEKYIKKPGGVLVSGIKFNKDEDAVAFLEIVKGKKTEFAELAKEKNAANFKDFGRVGDQPDQMMGGSDVPGAIKKMALELGNLPDVAKVKVGKNIWVIHVSDKKAPEYFSIDEIKPQLENMLKSNKFREILDKKVQELREEFTVDVNESFFKEKEVKIPEGVEIEKSEEAAPTEAEEVEINEVSTSI